ncbi:MAG: class I SAM-dependent methyltransferase [Anaerolineae bacterium]|nr:class I SAM-dependent methyltransferase [Anaerolineae bacterium]
MILDRFAQEVRDLGPSCDLGCGPGEVARYLHRRQVDAFGIDLSPQMIEQARRLTPEIDFRVGTMLALPDADASWGSIAAFYSIIHIRREQVGQALREMQRVLRPGGKLLLTFHIGSQVTHLDRWWDREVCVDFLFFQPKTMCAHLQAAGFDVLETIEREPYPPEVEAQTQRAYILAQKPVDC